MGVGVGHLCVKGVYSVLWDCDVGVWEGWCIMLML